ADVRVVSATHRDLAAMAAEGSFRQDLYFRLHVFRIHLPPLRERRDDIPLLMQHFLKHYRERYRRDVRGFSQRAVKALFNYGYPGNIRELQNLIERAVIMVNDGELIDVHQLFRGGEEQGDNMLSLNSPATGGRLVGGPERSGASASAPLAPGQTLEEAEQQWIAAALRRSGGNIAAAARQLGITRATLLYRARRHGLTVGRSARA
ncbi:MAG: helix-turn-helix domain-containing protein, partial [Hydrogenophaga sp.]